MLPSDYLDDVDGINLCRNCKMEYLDDYSDNNGEHKPYKFQKKIDPKKFKTLDRFRFAFSSETKISSKVKNLLY